MVVSSPASSQGGEGSDSQAETGEAEPITLVAALWYYNKYDIDFDTTEPLLCEIRTTVSHHSTLLQIIMCT